MSEKHKKNKVKILYLSFNKDKSCLALGMQKGYRIYDLTKKDLFYYQRILGKGIGIIEMIEKTCILGLVGGGNDPWRDPKQVNLYDDRLGKIIAHVKFNSNVLNIRLKKDKILVICENNIYIITYSNFKSIDSIEFGEEKKKKIIFAFTLDPDVDKLAYNLKKNLENKIIINSYDKDNKKTKVELKTKFDLNHIINCMEFNNKGQLLAITAINYKYLEIYNSETGLIMYKCELESDYLNNKNISFSQENDFISCFLDNGVVNIFNIKSEVNMLEDDEEEENINLNVNNNINNEVKDIIIWTKFYLPEKYVICSIVNFFENEQHKKYVICIGNKGNYYLVIFDKNKSENLALKICEKYFLKNEDAFENPI